MFVSLPAVSYASYKNNPVLSMGMSAIIPGSGQMLNGDYKKGFFFMAIELLALNQKSKYTKNAENIIQDYEDYALDFWSVEKWLKDFYLYKNYNYEIYQGFVNPGNDGKYCNENAEGLYCNDDNYFDIWDYSHGVTFLSNNQTNTYYSIDSDYSHVCSGVMSSSLGGSCDLYIYNNIDDFIVPWGELQIDLDGNVELDEDGLPILNFEGVQAIRDYHFHEGLGKYPEFFSGWLDATLENSWLENRNGYKVPMSNHKSVYQNLRNKSNKEFDKEEIMLSVIFLNHAISMLDSFLRSMNMINKIDVNSNIDYDKNFNAKGISLSLKW